MANKYKLVQHNVAKLKRLFFVIYILLYLLNLLNFSSSSDWVGSNTVRFSSELLLLFTSTDIKCYSLFIHTHKSPLFNLLSPDTGSPMPMPTQFIFLSGSAAVKSYVVHPRFDEDSEFESFEYFFEARRCFARRISIKS
jgi:hypothetical protein